MIYFLYRGHNENKPVYSTDVKNAKLQLPLHIAAMNKYCAKNVIQLLAKDLPVSLKVSMIFQVYCLPLLHKIFVIVDTNDGWTKSHGWFLTNSFSMSI